MGPWIYLLYSWSLDLPIIKLVPGFTYYKVGPWTHLLKRWSLDLPIIKLVPGIIIKLVPGIIIKLVPGINIKLVPGITYHKVGPWIYLLRSFDEMTVPL